MPQQTVLVKYLYKNEFPPSNEWEDSEYELPVQHVNSSFTIHSPSNFQHVMRDVPWPLLVLVCSICFWASRAAAVALVVVHHGNTVSGVDQAGDGGDALSLGCLMLRRCSRAVLSG